MFIYLPYQPLYVPGATPAQRAEFECPVKGGAEAERSTVPFYLSRTPWVMFQVRRLTRPRITPTLVVRAVSYAPCRT